MLIRRVPVALLYPGVRVPELKSGQIGGGRSFFLWQIGDFYFHAVFNLLSFRYPPGRGDDFSIGLSKTNSRHLCVKNARNEKMAMKENFPFRAFGVDRGSPLVLRKVPQRSQTPPGGCIILAFFLQSLASLLISSTSRCTALSHRAAEHRAFS